METAQCGCSVVGSIKSILDCRRCHWIWKCICAYVRVCGDCLQIVCFTGHCTNATVLMCLNMPLRYHSGFSELITTSDCASPNIIAFYINPLSVTFKLIPTCPTRFVLAGSYNARNNLLSRDLSVCFNDNAINLAIRSASIAW